LSLAQELLLTNYKGEAEAKPTKINKSKDAHSPIYGRLRHFLTFFPKKTNPFGKSRIQSPKEIIARCVKWIYYAKPAGFKGYVKNFVTITLDKYNTSKSPKILSLVIL
jgi:hypothetical protein